MLKLAKEKKTAFAKAVLESKSYCKKSGVTKTALLKASQSTRKDLQSNRSAAETHVSARPSTSGGVNRGTGRSKTINSIANFILDPNSQNNDTYSRDNFGSSQPGLNHNFSKPNKVKRNRSFGGGFTA